MQLVKSKKLGTSLVPQGWYHHSGHRLDPQSGKQDPIYHASMLSLQSCPTLCSLWTTAPLGPLSMGLSRQEYWSGLPCPPPGNLPYLGIEPMSLMSPALAGGFFTASTTWEAFSHTMQHSQYVKKKKRRRKRKIVRNWEASQEGAAVLREQRDCQSRLPDILSCIGEGVNCCKLPSPLYSTIIVKDGESSCILFTLIPPVYYSAFLKELESHSGNFSIIVK